MNDGIIESENATSNCYPDGILQFFQIFFFSSSKFEDGCKLMDPNNKGFQAKTKFIKPEFPKNAATKKAKPINKTNKSI